MHRGNPILLVTFLWLWLSCEPARQDPLAEAAADLPLLHATIAPPAEKLSPALRRALDVGGREDRRRVLVDLTPQLDLQTYGERLSAERLTKTERRDAIADALRRLAEASQSRLRPFLEDLRSRGQVESYRGFSIVNRLMLVADARAIRALSERADVAAISEDVATDVSVLAARTHGGELRETSWALTAIGADSAWRLGLDGTGVVVGIIDAGASATHEQLRGNYRAEGRSWHDPAGQAAEPVDGMTGHGTQILSAAVGGNVGDRLVGVAPGARWVACAGVPEGRYSSVAFTECADWMLHAGQPDVLINAWLLPDSGCDLSLRPIIDAWRAAEVLPVFAAGNYGPDSQTDRSPANYGDMYPGGASVLAVGGMAAPDSAFQGSSRGPSSCDGGIFPSLVAPAQGVPAAFPLSTTTYIQSEGTSVAAGLIAGAAALLLERHPEAAVFELESALRAGALDLGAPGPDNTFGHGMVYIPGALEALGRRLGKSETPNSASDTPRQR